MSNLYLSFRELADPIMLERFDRIVPRWHKFFKENEDRCKSECENSARAELKKRMNKEVVLSALIEVLLEGTPDSDDRILFDYYGRQLFFPGDFAGADAGAGAGAGAGADAGGVKVVGGAHVRGARCKGTRCKGTRCKGKRTRHRKRKRN